MPACAVWAPFAANVLGAARPKPTPVYDWPAAGVKLKVGRLKVPAVVPTEPPVAR